MRRAKRFIDGSDVREKKSVDGASLACESGRRRVMLAGTGVGFSLRDTTDTLNVGEVLRYYSDESTVPVR